MRRRSTVALPDTLAADLGQGWSVPLEDTFGEFQMGIWLREGGVEKTAADAAAAGWGGDRLAVLEGPDGAWALAMHTTWDTPADAEAFDAAATTALERAGGPGKILQTDDGTRPLGPRRRRCRDAGAAWRAPSTWLADAVPSSPSYIEAGAEIPSRPSALARVTWAALARARRAADRAGSAASTTRASR